VASALEPKPKAIAAKIELFPVPFSPPMKLISAQDAPVSLVDGRRSLSWQGTRLRRVRSWHAHELDDLALCHRQQNGRDAPTFDEIRGKIVVAHKV
jgi:hypothetical protein